MEQSRITVISPDTEWEMMQIRGLWTTFTWNSKDKEGDVELSCESNENGTETLYLNQDEIKQLITFLQKQVI